MIYTILEILGIWWIADRICIIIALRQRGKMLRIVRTNRALKHMIRLLEKYSKVQKAKGNDKKNFHKGRVNV